MSDHVVLAAPPVGDLPGVVFRPARYQRKGRKGSAGNLGARVLWAAAHTAECAETKTAAEGLLWYAATMDDGRIASWTYAVDCDSVTQSVLEADTAFHAPPINDFSIGVELAGRAAQTSLDWHDAYDNALLAGQAAPLFAGICQRHGLPVREPTDEQLLTGLQRATALATAPELATEQDWQDLVAEVGGIVTHAQVSRVFKKSTHTDPGPNFPMDEFLAAVEAELASLGG